MVQTSSNAAALALRGTSLGSGRGPGSVLTLAVLDPRGGEVRDAILNAFAGNPALKARYAAEVAKATERRAPMADAQADEPGDAARTSAGLAGRNVAHIALYETIMSHRSSFPPEGFAIRTELGDGASITTQIPPANDMPAPASASLSASPPSAATPNTSAQWRAAQALVTRAMAFDAERAAQTAAVQLSEAAMEGALAARQRAEAQYRID